MLGKKIEKKHHKTFEQLKQLTKNNVEFWDARELQVVLDYAT